MVRATFNYYNEPEERISNQRYFDREIMTKKDT